MSISCLSSTVEMSADSTLKMPRPLLLSSSLVWLSVQVVLIQPVVLHEVLSLLRSVVVVFVTCPATRERGLDRVDDVSERRPRGGASVPARLHHLVIPVNRITRV